MVQSSVHFHWGCQTHSRSSPPFFPQLITADQLKKDESTAEIVPDKKGSTPRILTWNLKMDPWKSRFLLDAIIFRIHVTFQGCLSDNASRASIEIHSFTVILCQLFAGLGTFLLQGQVYFKHTQEVLSAKKARAKGEIKAELGEKHRRKKKRKKKTAHCCYTPSNCL